MMDPAVLAAVVAAMGAGAVGNAVGKSPITGPQPWNKVLGPVAALLAPWAAKQFFKADLTSEQAIMIGTSASGIWSQGKNLYQFVRGVFFKKGLK